MSTELNKALARRIVEVYAPEFGGTARPVPRFTNQSGRLDRGRGQSGHALYSPYAAISCDDGDLDRSYRGEPGCGELGGLGLLFLSGAMG